MSDSTVHPSPHRDRVSPGWLFVYLLAGPLAWFVGLIVNYAFASYACFPGSERRSTLLAGWDWVSTSVPLVHLAGIAIAIVAGLGAWRAWSATRHEASGHLLDIGEGRSRFMSVWGALGCALFTLLIVFNLIAYAMVPPCAG